jgi:hypothetical protein
LAALPDEPPDDEPPDDEPLEDEPLEELDDEELELPEVAGVDGAAGFAADDDSPDPFVLPEPPELLDLSAARESVR